MNKLEKYIEDLKFIKWVFDTDAEIEKYYENFFSEHPEQKEVFLKMKEELRLLAISEDQITDVKGSQLYDKISNRIDSNKKKKVRISYIKSFTRYAAIAIVFLVFGSIITYIPKLNRMDLAFSEEMFLKTAHFYPVLYLADGSKMEITTENKILDLSFKDKLIIGNDTVDHINFSTTGQANNLLVVPYGQQVKVKLEDKSTVWLNAGSRLVFPPSYHSKKREVYLVGEGFFDVKSDPSHPFFVNTSTIAIKVLGTKFNVSSYPDDDEVVTVLQEGKISILDNKSFITRVKAELLPDQVARFNKEKKQLSVGKADHELFTSWKQGSLIFEYQKISQLIAKVERYYNIRIILENQNKSEKIINGKLDLNASVDEVLEYIKKITNAEIKKINTNTYVLK